MPDAGVEEELKMDGFSTRLGRLRAVCILLLAFSAVHRVQSVVIGHYPSTVLINLSVVMTALRYDYSLVSRVAYVSIILNHWIARTNDEEKVLSVLGAGAFAFVESTWTSLTSGFPHTTWYQFYCNLAYTPFLLGTSYTFWGSFGGDCLFFGNEIDVIRVLCFPIAIYMLELIQGYSLIFIFGENRAWHYNGSLALFHGNITLAYFFVWILFGLVIEVSYLPLLLLRDQILHTLRKDGIVLYDVSNILLVTFIYAPLLHGCIISRRTYPDGDS
jgi:hypothetical protein